MSFQRIFNKKKPRVRKKPKFRLNPLSEGNLNIVTHKEVHIYDKDR